MISFVYCKSVAAMEENAHTVLWTNQTGYINYYSVARDLWQRKPPLSSSGYTLGFGLP